VAGGLDCARRDDHHWRRSIHAIKSLERIDSSPGWWGTRPLTNASRYVRFSWTVSRQLNFSFLSFAPEFPHCLLDATVLWPRCSFSGRPVSGELQAAAQAQPRPRDPAVVGPQSLMCLFCTRCKNASVSIPPSDRPAELGDDICPGNRWKRGAAEQA